MIELIGLIGGAVTRLFPTVLDFFKQGRDLKYEVQRLDREIELEKTRGANAQAEIVATAGASVDVSWAQGLVDALRTQTQITGDKWLDRINVSVRPILTYWWCIVLYTAAKGLLAYSGYEAGMGASELADVLLTEFDRAVVGSIIGFWFVDRSLRRAGMK